MASHSPLNEVRKLVHRAYLFYDAHFPFHRGKYRLGILLEKLVGKAVYEVDGVALRLSPLAVLDRKLITREGHDPLVVENILRSLGGGGHFIDVGANIGYMTLVAARALGGRGRVFAFEPSPREFKTLLENIEMNHVSNVTPIEKGIGPARSESTLYVAYKDNPGMNSRLRIRTYASPMTVSFVPVAEAMTADDLARVACVKIDVEGDEMSVLDAFEPVMGLMKRATFIVEITRRYLEQAGRSPEELYAFFGRHGFTPLVGAEMEKAAPVQYDEVFVPAAGSRVPGRSGVERP
ncbi:MAG: FkbM family methyltransferase [Acidobacteria bacterium]|nr:FkbM family methyltransferase [Acidobacteriota bacterium]